jgi:hypothetical protein
MFLRGNGRMLFMETLYIFLPIAIVILILGALAIAFVRSKYFEEIFGKGLHGQKPLKIDIKRTALVCAPLLVVFGGGAFTAYFGKAFITMPVTVILGMGMFVYTGRRIEDYGELNEKWGLAQKAYIMTLVVPFCMTFLMSLLLFSGFDFKKVIGLFTL